MLGSSLDPSTERRALNIVVDGTPRLLVEPDHPMLNPEAVDGDRPSAGSQTSRSNARDASRLVSRAHQAHHGLLGVRPLLADLEGRAHRRFEQRELVVEELQLLLERLDV